MSYIRCGTTKNLCQSDIAQFQTSRGVGAAITLTLINHNGIIVVSNCMNAGGNYSFHVIDTDKVLTELYSSQRDNDPRGGMTVYAFKNGKEKSVTFQIPYPNTDWAYGNISVCEIS